MNMKTKKLMKINGFSRLLLGMLVVLMLSPVLVVGQGNCKEAVSIEADTLCDMETYKLVGTEYWFSFEVSDTAFFQMGASELDVGIEAMYLYKGDCKNLVLVAMDTVLSGGLLAIGDSLLMDEYYIRIVFADDEGEFEFCVYQEPDVEPSTANISRYYVPYNCQYEDVCFIGNVYISGPQPPPSFYEINWSFYGMHPDYTNTTYTTHDTICFQMDSIGTFMASICIVQWGEDIYGDTIFYQVCDSVSYEVKGVPFIDIDLSNNSSSYFEGCNNDTCVFNCSTTYISFTDTSRYIPDATPPNQALQWEIDTAGGVMGDYVFIQSTMTNPGGGFVWNGFGFGPGTYQVYVWGGNDCGSDTAMKVIVIEEPSAFFIHDTVCEGSYTNFIDSSQCAYNWNWDFGDGGTDTIEDPSHYYSLAGVYYVTLYINDSTYWYSDSVLVHPTPSVPITMGYFIDCDSLHWDTIVQTTPDCYYVWSYNTANWNDTIWTNTFVLNMPYSDTVIWIMAVDSITGCTSEPFMLVISPCCGEEYLFWDNITVVSDTIIYADTLAINGTVVIDDCDVTLSHTLVYMNSHSKIEIIGDGSLYLDKDSIMVCPGMDYMWDGIYVLDDSAKIYGTGNYIRDAENAIVVKNCGDYDLELFYFDYNYKCIVVDSCNQCLLDTLHTVIRSDFRCSDTAEMLLPYYNTRGYSGVEIDNVDSIQIGNIPNNTHIPPSVYNHRNRFENLDYGIINVNSNLFVFNNAFKDIDQNNPNPPSAYIGVGIYSEASSTKNLVVGKNASSGCWSNTFENCWEGVYAVNNQNVSIVNDTIFNGIDYGFYVRNMDTKSLYIDSNVIDSVKYGVFVYNNQGMGVNKFVSYNSIRGCDYGVYVTSNSQVFSLRVWDNEIEGGYYPISFLNTRRANVQDNFIEFDYSSVPAGYTPPMGIYAGNSRYAIIMGNDVYYTGSSGWKPMGIYADLSPDAYIECNRLYTQYDGIVCVGNMPNSTLKLNLMNGCTYGMYMNSATIGDQLSDSTQTDNRWVNSGTYKMSGTFNVPTNWWYTTNVSSEYSPLPTLTYNLFAQSTSIAPSSCSGGGATSSMGGGDTESKLLESFIYVNNTSENQYYEKVYKYGLIKDNTAVLFGASANTLSLYSNIQQSNIDEFFSLNNLIANENYLSAAVSSQSISASNNIEKSLLKVYDVQIAQGKDKRNYLSNTEYLQFMDIADESTLETGYAVFEACGMLGIHPVIEYHMEAKTRSAEVKDDENVASVYPNPTNNNISVSINCKITSELSIFDINGRLMLRKVMPSGMYIDNIVLDNFAEGCYLIFIFDEQKNCIMRDKLLIVK
jgi:PKD domain/Right handed beta helix region/Secretion system C-terminal sorting domain